MKYVYRVYFIADKYKKVMLFSLFSLSFFGGLYVYLEYYGLGVIKSIYYALVQFVGDVKMPAEIGLDKNSTTFDINSVNKLNDNYYLIYISGVLAFFTSVLTFLLLFFKEIINNLYSGYMAKQGEHIIVIGLGNKGTHFINSLLDKEIKSTLVQKIKNNIIAIEKNSKNSNIEKYREKGIGVIVGDGSDIDILNKSNIYKAKNIVLLAGQDINNLEIALAVQEEITSNEITQKNKKLKNTLHQNLYIHIDDRSLYKFYREGGLLYNTKNLPVKIFSMAQNSAKSLFLEHYIDGDSREYIDSNKPFSIAIVGNTKLALEVIKQACEIAHFPNENRMNIYCIDQNIEKFEEEVLAHYKYIEDILNINLIYKKLDWTTQSFYNDALWKDDITNIILCDKSAQNNLDIASQLLDNTYIKEAHLGLLKSKIHIAVYENKEIAQSLNDNRDKYMNCYTFSLTQDMASAGHVLEEEYENIAKAIHGGYGEAYEPTVQITLDAMNEKWLDNAKLSDRESNYAQGYHIPMKLKALGLKIKVPKKDETIEEIREKFEDMAINLKNERKILNLTKKKLIECTENFYPIEDNKFKYFPVMYKTLFEKLIRAEHNRWNAHHYLKGWSFSDVTNKDIKKHSCLLPLSSFPNELKYTVLYDMYSILYIPNYLAQVKKSIMPYPRTKLVMGVTGHRNLQYQKEINQILKDELEKLNKVYELRTIISPLADGSDRMVAKILRDDYEAKLIVPLPFKKSEYEQDFSKESRKEFNDMLKTSFSNNYAVGSLDNNSRDECYLNVGKEVVDQCDILIALWDGKEANGVGGTGDIVKYAEEHRKAILHINTETLVVKNKFKKGKNE